jgi:hypothetical protein
MENVTYELKTKNEHFIVFKILRVLGVFLGSWVGLWILMMMAMRRSGGRAMSEGVFEIVSNGVLYAAIGIAIYFIYTKVKDKQVEKIVFNYDQSKLLITYKSYFLHIKSHGAFPLKSLRSTLGSGQSIIYGSFYILSINYGNVRVVHIDKSAADWQRLPNFLLKIHERTNESSGVKSVDDLYYFKKNDIANGS